MRRCGRGAICPMHALCSACMSLIQTRHFSATKHNMIVCCLCAHGDCCWQSMSQLCVLSRKVARLRSLNCNIMRLSSLRCQALHLQTSLRPWALYTLQTSHQKVIAHATSVATHQLQTILTCQRCAPRWHPNRHRLDAKGGPNSKVLCALAIPVMSD